MNENGDIIESSWKDGKRHGLCRVIHEDAVIVAVFKEGEVKAIRSFTGKFVETAREDEEYLLEDFGWDKFERNILSKELARAEN